MGRIQPLRAGLIALAAVLLPSLAGCDAAGYMANAVAGGESPPITVTAEYEGLENQSVAVLVNADLPILYCHPQVQLEISAAVSERLAANVPGVTVINPHHVYEFQQRNIYWTTSTYTQLCQTLDVSRLVWIELQEFRLHEPGNSVMYRGVLTARVEVAEADADRPNVAQYANTVSVAYPPNRPEGVPEADPTTIRKGTLDLFARAVAQKFYEHKEKR